MVLFSYSFPFFFFDSDEAEHESRDLPPPTTTLNTGTVDPPQPMIHNNRTQGVNELGFGTTTLPSSLTASRSANPVGPPPLKIARPIPPVIAPSRQSVPVAATAPRTGTSQSNRDNGLSQPRNPYASNQSNRVELASRSAAASSVPTRMGSAASNSHNSVSVVDLTDSVDSPPDSNGVVAMDTHSEMSTNEILPYYRLLEIVNLAIRDPDAYQQARGMTWRVRLQQVGSKEYFNIEKRKKRSKGDEKKVSQLITANTWLSLSFSLCLTSIVL